MTSRNYDVVLRTVAWLSIATLAYVHRGRLGAVAASLVATCGVGWVAWLCYVMEPGWATWLCYQGVRAGGLLLFCGAVVHPSVRFRLAEATT